MGIGHIVIILISLSLFTIPAFAQDRCSSPDGYCMDRYGMNDPENYSSCLASVISQCEKERRSQPPPICLDSNGKEITFSRYTPVQDYDVVYDLILRGFNERDVEVDVFVLDNYKGTPQFESECVNIYKEYKQIGKESQIWNDTCPDLDSPYFIGDKVNEIYSILNGVCRFADLSAFAGEDGKPKSESTQEIVCGTGTVRNEKGQCVPERATMTSEMQQKSSGGGCLIATATFGTELSPQVQQLRELRDNYLMKTESGQSFMQGFNEFYYSFSPTIADYERENPVFKEAVKIVITPLISSLSILNYVDMDSEAEVLGYGISLILLNVGMYVAVPIGIGLVLVKNFQIAKLK